MYVICDQMEAISIEQVEQDAQAHRRGTASRS